MLSKNKNVLDVTLVLTQGAKLVVHLPPRSAGTTVLDSGLGRWTLDAMERFHRGQTFSPLAVVLMPQVCLFMLILVDDVKLTVLLIISEQVQGQYLSSGKAAALASAFPRWAGNYETSHGGQ